MKILNIFIALISFVNCSTNRRPEKNIIDHLFNANRYDHQLLPEVIRYSANELTRKTTLLDFQNEKNSIETIVDPKIRSDTNAVIDKINIYLRHIDNINIFKQTFETQLTFRQKWTDLNLGYNQNNGGLHQINLSPELKIWKPDLFITNEIDSRFHNLLEPNSLIRIYPNGTVLYSVRITLKTWCPMDLKYFPFDTQICSIIFASYGHTTDDIILNWKESDPIQVSNEFKNKFVNHMKLTKAKTGYRSSKTITGEYSGLKVDFEFERNSKFYICRWFMSSALCVLIVWLSFWLSAKCTKTRIGLIIISTLMLSCITKDINNNKPELDYCTTIDIWMMTCWLLVIVGYFQLGLVQYFNQKEDKQTKSLDKQENGNEKQLLENKSELLQQKWLQKSRISKLDFASIIGFPVIFVFIQLIVLLSHRLI